MCVSIRAGYSQCQPGGATTTVPTTTQPTTTTPTTIITTPTTTPTIPSGPVIVLPLGDSITYGMGSNDGNSYRKELKDLLAKDGITIDYIGTVKNGNIQDNDNEGHSGATIAQISGYADTPLRQKPQVRSVVLFSFFLSSFQSLSLYESSPVTLLLPRRSSHSWREPTT